MSNQNKLFFLTLSLLIVIGGGIAIYDGTICNPERQKIQAILDYMKAPNSIKKIQLFKSYPEWENNLVNDSVTITNASVLDTIRAMILNKKPIAWNKPMAEWDVDMKVTLNNDEVLNLQISGKINNYKEKGMTQLNFAFGHCSDAFPSYSLTLGAYLETLTDYQGKAYK